MCFELKDIEIFILTFSILHIELAIVTYTFICGACEKNNENEWYDLRINLQIKADVKHENWKQFCQFYIQNGVQASSIMLVPSHPTMMLHHPHQSPQSQNPQCLLLCPSAPLSFNSPFFLHSFMPAWFKVLGHCFLVSWKCWHHLLLLSIQLD